MNISPSGLPADSCTHVTNVTDSEHLRSAPTTPEAVYPEEAINGDRAFIACRRPLRPSEEYRSPTDEEWEPMQWEEFPGHREAPQARPRRLRPGLGNQLHP
jgi:hypothetical protein